MSVDLRLCPGFYYSTLQQQDEAVLLLTHKNPLCARTLSLPVVRGWLFGALRHKGFSLMHTLHTHSSWQCFTQEQLHTWAQEKDLQNTWFCNALYYKHRTWCVQIPAGSLATWNKLSTHSNHQELLITYFCNYTGQLSSVWVSQSQSNKKWLLVWLEQKNWL